MRIQKPKNSKIQNCFWHLHENIVVLDVAGTVPVCRVGLLPKEHCFSLSVNTFEVSSYIGGVSVVGFSPGQAGHGKVRDFPSLDLSV